MLEKTTRVNFLLDFYQPLLTPKQLNYMELYYEEDYSLGEVSEFLDVSRQAVYDNLKRTETLLENYEEKLGLYSQFNQRQKLLKRLKNHVNSDEGLELLRQLQETD